MKKFLKALCNITLIPILFGCISLLIVSYSIEATFSYKNVKHTIKETIKDSINQEPLTEDNIFSSIYKSAEEYQLSKEEVDKILENESVQELISKYAYASAMGKEMNLSSEEMTDITNGIIEVIEDNGVSLTTDQKNEMKSYMANNYQRVSVKTVDKNQITIRQILDRWTNKKIRIITIIATIICIGLIVAINWNKMLWIKIISGTTVSLSIILWLGCLVIPVVVKAFSNPNIANIIKEMITPITKISFVMFLVSFIIRVIYAIFTKKKKKEKELSTT